MKQDNTGIYVAIILVLGVGYFYYVNNIQSQVKKAEVLTKWF